MKPFRSSGQSFNEIPLTDPKKSSFDLSYTNKGSGKIGRLIPVSSKECLPGDRVSCDVHSLLRFEPLAVPLLSDMQLRHHQYFVPFRQVWSSFESFITGGKDGYSDSHVIPAVNPKILMSWLNWSFCGMLKEYLPVFLDSSYFKVDMLRQANASMPFGYAYLSNFNIRVPFTSDLSEVDMTLWADVLLEIRTFIHQFSNFVDSVSFSRAFQDFYCGTHPYNSATSTPDGIPAYYVDVWKYDNQLILDTFRQQTLPVLNLGASPTSKQILDAVESFMLDLYSLAFNSFVGPSSNWDYLGYPVDFWNKNGYKGVRNNEVQGVSVLALDSLPAMAKLNWLRNSKLLVQPDLPLGVYVARFIESEEGISYPFAHFVVDVMASSLDGTSKFSILPLRSMYRIWYFNYRDQNLEADVLDPDSSAFKSDDGYNFIMSMLFSRCCAWSKDLFTTATLQAYSTNLVVPIRDDTEAKLEDSTLEVPVVDLPDGTSTNVTVKMPTHFVQVDNSPLASISGLTLSNLRKVQALARWLDKNLFVGFQYADQLFSHYNVKYSDARLQIPEYLAGNSELVRMDVITNNTTTAQQTAGDQVSRAQGLTRSSVDNYFIEEHGFYFAIMSVLPDQSYPFGVDRSLLMQNKFDIAFPEFAQLGSDIVSSLELFDSSYSEGNSDTYRQFAAFGYQGRYYHYKSNFSVQHGELNTSRREYTFARYFDRTPVLDASFVHCTPTLQMFVSPYSDQFVYDVLINLRAQRALPVYDQVL